MSNSSSVFGKLHILKFVLLGHWLESLAKGVICIRNDNKCLMVEVLNLLLHVTHLLTIYDEEYHLLIAVGN